VRRALRFLTAPDRAHQPLIGLSRISTAIYALSNGSALSEEAAIPEQMARLVEKYRCLKCPMGQAGAPSTASLDVVVLTGATGSLGAALLAELVVRADVRLVYCLCRAKDDDEALARVVLSLDSRGLSTDLRGKVVAVAADLGSTSLGLPLERYDEMAKQVTTVIHNAWSVNFNQQLASFESHIRGAVNLMQLALTPIVVGRFYFTSSVSAVANYRGPGYVPEAVIDDWTVAQGMGYAQSKAVTEKLCEIVSRETPLLAGILRVGQMVGGTSSAVWNETEAISLIIKVLPRFWPGR
jgi:thioester reductase-like protein